MHCESPADQDQLTVMKNNLIQRDAESGKQLRVFIETPARLCNFFSDSKVTMNLAEVLKEASLRKTEIQDVEIRCVSGAALYMLQSHLDPNHLHSGSRYNAQECWCAIDQVTFNDVKKEFYAYLNYLQEARNSYSEDTIKKIFDEKLTQAQEDYKELENDLKSYKIGLDENILQVSKRLYANNPNDKLGSRHTLSTRIFHVFDPLLELYIFHQILTSREIPEIVVIAGADHTRSVMSMLRTLRVKRVRSCGRIDSNVLEKADVAALDKKDLDFFEGQGVCLSGCLIV